MANWYYYDNKGNKIGTVSGEVLKQLAESGIVQPVTPVESAEWQKGIVSQIKGLFTLKPHV